MSDILLGVIVFSSVILLLVIILNVLGDILLPQGEVTLLINDDADKSINVQTGGTVLSALAAQSVYLPSACGGQGTCAQCKCQVIEGGGDILPTEEAYISRSDQKDNWRLGCQVKIRNDMKIKVPDEIFSIRKWDAVVKSNDNVATFIKELILELPEDDPIHFESGGYIQIDVPSYKGLEYKNFEIEDLYTSDWDKFDIWQYVAENKEPVFRAYSMANHPAEGNIIMLNIRIASPPPDNPSAPPGIASSYVFDLKEGDKVTVSGPYGEFFINESESEMLYVGGGAGMAPMRSHLYHLFKTLKTGRKVTYWYGGRSKRELFYIDHFKSLEKDFPNFKFYMALSEPMEEDNWKVKDGIDGDGDGFIGFIHNCVIDNYLNHHDAPEDIELYFCGPPLMNKAVQKMGEDFGIPDENIRFDDFGG